MQEPLFKYLKKRTAKVEQISKEILAYEEVQKDYAKEIYPLVSDKDEVGIEIEVEKVGAGGDLTYYMVWQAHQDGSLRNNGMEFVSLPIKGSRIHYALNQFFDRVPKTYHFSPRTSIHIHVNVLDLLPKQIGSMCMVTTVFEKLLYRFVGGNRDKNNFAVPVCDTDFNQFIKLFTADEWHMFGSLEQRRYLGLNIDAVRKYGTLEYRHMGGTDDKVKIVKWINLILSIKKYAEKNTFENIKERIDRLNTDSQYMNFLNDVFGSSALLLDASNLKADLEQNVSVVKKFVSPNEFWTEIRNGFSEQSVWYLKATEKVKAPNYLTLDMLKTPATRRAAPRPMFPERTVGERQAQLDRAVERIRREEQRTGLFDRALQGRAGIPPAPPPPQNPQPDAIHAGMWQPFNAQNIEQIVINAAPPQPDPEAWFDYRPDIDEDE